MEKDFFQSQIFLASVKELKKIEQQLPEVSRTLSTTQVLEKNHRSGKVLTELSKKLPRIEKNQLYQKVAKILKKNARQLFYYQQFYQHFPHKVPKIANVENLTWTHVRATLKLQSKEEILYYLNEAAEAGTPSRHLELAVRHDLFNLIKSSSKAHPKGKIIRDMTPTYTFVAVLVAVIDGDTLELIAEQGFYAQYRLRIRLHGINAPEMHGPQAKKAQESKDFVIKALSELEFMIIKTYKTDAFGRYVADVLYHPLWTDHKKIFEEGFYLNQQLLDFGLAKLAVY
ncbi:MAG: thermonuclease family protein [Deltaproteobacteria bacterium]|nr:thermonuclease family protein [Deltaproteobacteria bacterium]